MGLGIEQTGVLLLVAGVVAILARRLQLPYTVGLVIAGVFLAFSPLRSEVELTSELIFTALLPPLVFEAAFYIPWRDLRRNMPVILVLSTLGVILSAAVTALGMVYIAGWEVVSALLFGFLIAATDPVSVIAFFREAGVHGRLRLLVESESLLNDGTAAVAFSVMLMLARGGRVGAPEAFGMLLYMTAGGILCGLFVSWLVLLLAGRTEDHLVEITFSTIAAYGSFLLAERLGVSGVLATLTAGLVIANIGPRGAFSVRGRDAVVYFWEYAAFVANSLIFLLIGIREAEQRFAQILPLALLAIGLVILGRALAVYPTSAIFARSSLRVDLKHQHVLFWGGLRGALALALALALPPGIAHRSEIVTLALAVVAFSVIVQGLTTGPLLRRLGLLRQADKD